MYDQAIDELRYAQNIWGDSSPIGATLAWTYREQGKAETGSQQFSLYRGAINLMKRAYPQYLAAGGEQLPRDILRIIFPIAYWDLIQKYAARSGPRSVPGRGARRAGVDLRRRTSGRRPKPSALLQLDAVDGPADTRSGST